MSKKMLNPRLISVLHRIAPDTSPLRKNKNAILGCNELGFHDQDVPRSRERQYSNISLFFFLKADIDMNDSFPKKKKTLGQISW